MREGGIVSNVFVIRRSEVNHSLSRVSKNQGYRIWRGAELPHPRHSGESPLLSGIKRK
jgi:hypothetical protein